MVFGIGVLVISLGAIAAGRGYLKTAHRMRSFQTTRGRVVGHELAHVSGLSPEGRWGTGGNYRPKLTYTYRVDGVDYTSDRSTYATRGVRQSLAEQQLAATPDEVTVFYDPDRPAEAYLELHTPRLGYVLVAGGIAGVVIGLLAILVATAYGDVDRHVGARRQPERTHAPGRASRRDAENAGLRSRRLDAPTARGFRLSPCGRCHGRCLCAYRTGRC